MQPQNNETQPGLEQAPVQPLGGPENIPVLPSPEAGINTGAERREQVAEAQAAVADAGFTTVTPVTPVTPAEPPVTTPLPPAPTAGPMTASDEDVIEKEWVDKAKQIITETGDDPYQRSNRVNELQRDYLKKRYGKDLGRSA